MIMDNYGFITQPSLNKELFQNSYSLQNTTNLFKAGYLRLSLKHFYLITFSRY